MPKPFKPNSPRPLPPNAEIVDHEGKPHVRIRWRGRMSLFPMTKDGRNYLRPSKCWYFELRDGAGAVKRLKGFADLKATEQLAAEAERKASRVRVGIIDAAEEHACRPLSQHLKDYSAALEAKGGKVEHVRQTVGRISALLAGCGFVYPQDADEPKAANWLNALRRNDAPVELPPGESHTPADTARLLGISGAAVRATVKRMNLAAIGNGKARRLPRATL